MPGSASFALVALPIPVRQTFAYRVPDALAERVRPGAQVQVPFRGRPRRGVVVAVTAEPPAHEAQPVTAVLLEAALSPHLLELGRWIADYYLAPIGEVLVAALPGGLEGFAKSRARRSAIEERDLKLALPERVRLTEGQRAALAAVDAARQRGAFAPLLLHGVTASGKTEVYLRAAQAVREHGGQTLVLVPEVALSAQVVGAFRKRFGGRVGVLHSYLSVGERRRNWELAQRGALDVVVGARSAVFAPLPRLGMVVVDEEHEPSYKQSERLRYHARDVAVRRAQMLGIPVVLGSATPSLETLANVARGKYARVRLAERVDKRTMPRVRVVDLRRGASAGLLTPTLRGALAERLERREQALLFLNRRGHSHHMQCRGCGWTPECPQCDITLTLHVAPRAWRCHYCDHAVPATATCPNCHAALFRYGASGTQRVERELLAAFPGARVLRLDTDVTRAGGGRDLGERFRRGDADVLVGTQMIAKGFDFPNVTLVGVLDADVGLHLPDFRAAERTYQLLVQVAGRSGRGVKAGEVWVQTCTPEHPAIAAAVLHDERAFLDHELRQRREARYPPYVRLVSLGFAGRDEASVERAAHEAAEGLRGATSAEAAELTLGLPDVTDDGFANTPLGEISAGSGERPERSSATPQVAIADGDADESEEPELQVLGPAPHAFARLRGLHRWHVLLKSRRAALVREAAARALAAFESAAARKGVRMTVDVDPLDVL